MSSHFTLQQINLILLLKTLKSNIIQYLHKFNYLRLTGVRFRTNYLFTIQHLVTKYQVGTQYHCGSKFSGAMDVVKHSRQTGKEFIRNVRIFYKTVYSPNKKLKTKYGQNRIFDWKPAAILCLIAQTLILTGQKENLGTNLGVSSIIPTL